ncbi:MAG: hypothetical protein AB7O62_06390 [Pirellulales bacterium]
MSMLSKVFVVLVLLAGLAFMWAAARTGVMLENGRERVAKLEKEIATAEVTLKNTTDGTDPETAKISPTELLAQFPTDLNAAGVPNEPDPRFVGYSVAQLKTVLEHVVSGRGRIWFHTKPQRPDGNGNVTIDVPAPQNHKIETKMILYVLDEAEYASGGRYLGEFEVTAAQDGQSTVTLSPTLPLTAEQVQRLNAAAGGLWSLYETMPNDRRDVLAGLSDDQIKAMLPIPDDAGGDNRRRPIVEEFLRDGKPAQPDDPADRLFVLLNFIKDDAAAQQVLTSALAEARIRPADDVLKNKYHVANWDEFVGQEVPKMLKSGQVYEIEKSVADKLIGAEIARQVGPTIYRRPLQDFGVILREFQRELPLREAAIRDLQKELQDVEASTKDANIHITFNQSEVQSLETERDRLKKELALAEARSGKMAADLKKAKAAVSKTAKANRDLAVKLAKVQEEAIRRAEEAINYDSASTSP